MKRYIFIIVLGVLAMTVLISPVSASTNVSLSPSSINVKEGQSFDISITVNPKSVNNYAVKIQLQYPVDILELESFTFSDDWMAFSNDDYDLIDNTNGILIKTAGFPGGVSTLIPFGTASFSVKQGGEGVIKIGKDSFALDILSEDVFDGLLDETTVKVTAVISPEDVVTEEATDNKETVPEEVVVVEEKITPEEDVYGENTPEEETFTEEATTSPALFDILTSPATEKVQKRSCLPVTLGVIVVFISAGYLFYRRRDKKLHNGKTEEKE